eukprot:6115730-Lingulodinium_polyedra.AAC.1
MPGLQDLLGVFVALARGTRGREAGERDPFHGPAEAILGLLRCQGAPGVRQRAPVREVSHCLDQLLLRGVGV